MALLIVPPPISLADGDEFFGRGVQCSRKGLVGLDVSYFRLVGRRLPVLVGCDGGHHSCRFDGSWAALSRASTAAALPDGAAAERFVC